MNIEELLQEETILSLTPEAPQPPVITEQAVPVFEEENYLTDVEREQVESFVKQINLNDSATILSYGASSQKKMADFSEGTLENVRSKDLGEIGDLLNNVVTEIKSFDEPEAKGITGFFKSKAKSIQNMKARYEKAENQIEKISKALEGHQVQLLKDSAMLDQLYELNKKYFRELNMYILAGKKKLHEVRTVDLPALKNQATLSGRAEDAQDVRDLENSCIRFEKKIHDLELTRMVSLQMAPQIRMVQSSDQDMSEKIQSTLTNTIPLWKNQMVLALGIEHTRQAAIAQRQVTDMTNELLKKNAEALKMASVETAKESERGIVDLDTPVHTNESLVQTIDEVIKIQQEGRQKRFEAQQRLSELEDALKQKLLES